MSESLLLGRTGVLLRFLAPVLGHVLATVTPDEGKQVAQRAEDDVMTNASLRRLRSATSQELLDLDVDGVAEDEAAWLHGLADRIDAAH